MYKNPNHLCLLVECRVVCVLSQSAEFLAAKSEVVMAGGDALLNAAGLSSVPFLVVERKAGGEFGRCGKTIEVCQ